MRSKNPALANAEDNDGKITLGVKEFKRIIGRAYAAGADQLKNDEGLMDNLFGSLFGRK